MKLDVRKIGQGSTTVNLPEGSTVLDAVRASGFSAEGCIVTRERAQVSLDAQVAHGDTITIVSNVKGGSEELTATLSRLGRGQEKVVFQRGEILGDLLGRHEPDGSRVFLNGREASLGEVLQNGDNIILAPNVEGGQ